MSDIFMNSKEMAMRLYEKKEYGEALKYFHDVNSIREEKFVVAYSESLLSKKLIQECGLYCEKIIEEGFMYEEILFNLFIIYRTTMRIDD